MRIIKTGITPKHTIEKECSVCHCVFEYDKHDVHSDQRDGDYVICPTCGRYISHQYSAINQW